MRCSASPYAPGFGSGSVHPAKSCWTCSRNAASACARTGAAPASACTASLERSRTRECEMVSCEVSAAALRMSSTASTAMPSAASETNWRRCAKSPPIPTSRCSVSGLSVRMRRDDRRRTAAAAVLPGDGEPPARIAHLPLLNAAPERDGAQVVTVQPARELPEHWMLGIGGHTLDHELVAGHTEGHRRSILKQQRGAPGHSRRRRRERWVSFGIHGMLVQRDRQLNQEIGEVTRQRRALTAGCRHEPKDTSNGNARRTNG